MSSRFPRRLASFNPSDRALNSALADGGSGGRAGWIVSLSLYFAFSAAVFVAQGSQPPLGPDHLSYIELADSIIASCPNGDFWRETNSIRFFGVLLAYLHGWTASHVLSMKVLLAVFSVLYLVAAELFFRLFAQARWHAVLFALLSGFAVSFGFASWGVTDSTALLPRTLVAPIVMLSMWFWFKYDGRPQKYLVFPFLILGSLTHLSTFYTIGVLVIVEVLDFALLRKMRVDRQGPAFLAGLLLAGMLLFGFEYVGLSNKTISSYVPDMLRSMGFEVPTVETGTLTLCRMAAPPAPATTATPAETIPAAASPESEPALISAEEAWAAELSLRPWRNMPLPMVNIANALSSSALILLLALAGMVAAGRSGFTRVDRLMVAMFFAVPVFAFAPQTALWVLRTFTSIHPATIEEVRALSLIMIPALYFILGLFERTLESRRPRAALGAAAIAVAVLALPLLMKCVPYWAREGILSAMMALRVVDSGSASGVANARVALGLSVGASPLYYSTQGVREWLMKNAPPGARILTDRDDLILLRDRIILGPRQVAVNIYRPTPAESELFLRTAASMKARDTERIRELAQSCGADFVVVDWRVEGAEFADDSFSVMKIRTDALRPRP